ncbi:S53 family peptidase [Amycolatopsis sp. NBC_01480]|uniref:S53 family peptidase n=1 Tax=Amycolatopsis sp. NBC_01480 TaxID=2903562 RepID=UPI002E2CFA8B|nr:S53 family serine peptidase [Amycolatopsis sp. NBC_01480]
MPLSSTATALMSALAFAAGAAAVPAGVQAAGPADGDRTVVAGNTPAWATPAAKVGGTDAAAVRHIQIALALRDEAGAARLAAAVSAPGNAGKGKFLTSQQFTDRFGPTDDAVAQVRDWLTREGVTVTGVSGNRHFIDAQAPTGDLERVFGATLSTFRSHVGGRTETLVAPDSPITIPRSLRTTVTAVLGLDDSAKTVRPQHTAPAAADAQDCARWWGEQNNADVPQKYPAGAQSNALCGYTGTSVRAMYGLGAGNSGAGTTVGVVGAYNSETVVDDTNRAAPQLGVPALAAGQYSAVLPEGGFTDQQQCNPDSWAGEQTLDVQAAHTVAPSAKIRYYAAKSCIGGLYDSVNQAVSDNAVDVLSLSWGNADGERSMTPAARDQFNSMALQAAIQGQSITVSSGDAGTNETLAGQPTASFPASSPWVTAVGGTSVGLDSANKPVMVTGWENSGNTLTGGQWVPQSDADGPFAGGAGGGASALYDTPDWQTGVVPASASHGHRAVPDIAALADSYTGMLVGQTVNGQFGIGSYGGTSLASPLIAGLAADAQQARGGRGGLLTPALYGMHGGIADVTPQKAGVWTSVMHALPGTTVPGSRGSYLVDFDARPQPQKEPLQSAPGWDNVTGVGTPDSGFVAALAAQ